MARVEIVIPRHIHVRMLELAGLNQETRGRLIYLRRQARGKRQLLVQTLVMTGRGKPHEVDVDPLHERAANFFSQRLRSINSAYGDLEWHTHTTTPQFSQTDRSNVTEYLRDDPDYVLLMYHRARQLALGHPERQHVIRVVDSTSTHLANERNLQAIRDSVVRENGLVLPVFRATRDR